MSNKTINKRINFATSNILEYPDLLEVQLKSFKDFFQLETTPENRKNEGLYQVFQEIFPIEDTRNSYKLEFIDYFIDPPQYSIEECLDRGLTYSVPLKAKLRLSCTDSEHEGFETRVQDVYLGNIPYMTPAGTFVINGSERIIVSQLHRSPGVFFDQSMHANGTKLYSARIIPFKGSWIEFATDINNVMYAYIDRKKKLPVTTLLRAIGYNADKDIIDIFDLADEVNVNLEELRANKGRKLANNVIRTKFEDFIDEDTGEVTPVERNEIIVRRGEVLDDDTIDAILQSDEKTILLQKDENNSNEYAIIFNTLQKDPTYTEIEAINYIYKQLRNSEPPDESTARDVIDKLFFSEKRYDLGNVGRYRLNKKLNLSIDPQTRVLTNTDIIEIIKYLIELINSKATVDDIDHLSNRRVRTVGEQLANQFSVGLSRMARTIRERMNVRDSEQFNPIDLINAKTLSSVINSFFGTSQLSQFMDQTNPLAEITHKRRLSALGPGGLSRDRAGFEVRDVHYTHYGRLCPIESPEGPNIGLISSLCVYARIDDLGFIETPYRDVKNGKVDLSDAGCHYMSAEEEESKLVSLANVKMDKEGNILDDRIQCRLEADFPVVTKEQVDYMDVAPNQMASVAASLIPFLEHDDAHRALMGANMMRQAVPLLKPQAPMIATGVEHKIAYDSGVLKIAKRDGFVKYVDSDKIVIECSDGTTDTYILSKFERSNQSTCINQHPIVNKGDKVYGPIYDDKGNLTREGTVIADGPATDHGELALGRNMLIGFMSWEGYNYEDAVLISEELVRDDLYTSIHIEEYEIECRDTKLGDEQITRDIPNLSDEVLKNLDEDGIVMVGAEVKPGDILVGKVTPKGETELTPEERLLRAIFGEKAREVRDTSLRVPNGESGIVVDVKIFTRKNKDELAPGVNKLVRVYIAQKRKISVGDKMAGRHGNKGVVSRVLPKEDMPFLADGTPLQIVLNPLGVPSRMNIGQVLEVHLGLIAHMLDWKVATPVFDGANEQDIKQLFQQCGLVNEDGEVDGKIQLYDGRTGEPFENRATVGYMYYLKLHHLVDDKIHARSTGPYSVITQQPLGGKAQFGGQRFGEMEVWALEAYGAANVLQEILTVKSDDVVGRVKTYESIVKGSNISEPGIPESFKVLVKELQSLALDVKVLTEDNDEVKLREYDEDIDFDTPISKKHEELKEIDILGDNNIFGDLGESKSDADKSLFDTDDDDESIFSALTEGTPDMSDIFGTNSDEE